MINPYANAQHKFDDQMRLFDEAMIAKYNHSGPRYTSYPTALEFAPIDADMEKQILQKRDINTPLSLYVHIPFCRTLCYYCACNKIITKKNSTSNGYLDILFAEIDKKRALLKGDAYVSQIHLGGGTPTFLTDDELAQLFEFLQSKFNLADKNNADFGIEIDPRELRDSTLEVLRGLGFNRVSFGVQDLDEKVQIAVNRVQPQQLIEAVVDEARRLQYYSINIDLIYGLPHQTPNSLKNTVQKIIDIAPDRLSVFNYAHLPERFSPQKQIKNETLPSAKQKLAMLGGAIDLLTKAGYQYIGIDHFAKADDTLAKAQRQGTLHRNFQGYTTHGECDLLGFGVSAISQIGTHVLQNPTALDAYEQKILQNQLPAIKHMAQTDEDALRRYVIMQLLCHDYIDFADVLARFSVDFRAHFADEILRLADMQNDGLVRIDACGIRVLPKGRLLGRTVAMVFDEYLTKKHKNRFSRVI